MAATAAQLSYLGYLQQSTSQQEAEEQQFQVQEAKSHWEVSIARTKSELSKAKRALNSAMSTANLDNVIRFTEQVESLERGLEVANRVFAVLFPATEVAG